MSSSWAADSSSRKASRWPSAVVFEKSPASSQRSVVRAVLRAASPAASPGRTRSSSTTGPGSLTAAAPFGSGPA